uniref:Uncharacterized protein n=1 Tax=Strigamia maritima TaxID=126957 RepID=T1INA1_STRMM
MRRKRIRQERAKKRDEESCAEDEDVQCSTPVFFGPVNELLKCFEHDDEREIQHNLWLEREKVAQEAFLKEKERKEKIKNETSNREKKIRDEWEKQQAKDKEEKDKQALKEQSKKEREAALLKEISTQPTKLSSDGPSHNPEPPPNFGTEMDRDNCPFFLKTGACRFGDRCSRVHNRPSLSNIILIPNMYTHFSIEESFRDEYDTDIALEYEEPEKYNHFREFYEDVATEFKKIGRVIQFKTCCNHEPHLRGNVYVQYQFEEDALTAFKRFNGRWYAGKQISCEFATIARWKTAICGLYASKRCPKGRSCNFLHVFQNPRNEFHAADFDYVKNPNSSHRSSRSNSHSSQTRSSRSNRLRSRSRSRSKSTERTSKHRRKRSKKTRSSSRDISSDLKTERTSRPKKKSKKKKSSHRHHSDKYDSTSDSSTES